LSNRMVEMCDSPVQQETRYDRQLRLWGEHGQSALEASSVLFIGVNATTCEVAKNLILPGIGRLTLLDDETVRPRHLMSNFFLTQEDLDKSVSEAAFHWLSELNPSVKCSFDERNLDTLVEQNTEFFKRFSLVLVSRISLENLEKLKKLLFHENIPLFQVETFGMFGRIRVIMKEHAVFEEHPDSVLPDLRLDNPFPELTKYVESFDLDALDSASHKHVPYIVPLLRSILKWKTENSDKQLILDGKLGRENKNEIKKHFNSLRRFEDEENFDEGARAMNSTLNTTRVPPRLRDFLASAEFAAKSLTPSSTQFWILLKTLEKYLKHPESEGFLSGDVKENEKVLDLRC